MPRPSREKVDEADLAYLTATVYTLKARRLELGLSQQDVADLMGITQSGVSDIESLAGVPGASVLLRYARAVRSRLRFHLTVDTEGEHRG